MEYFYLIINEYASVEIAAIAVYAFLKRNPLFDHTIVILTDDDNEALKKVFSRLYFNTEFKPENTVPEDNWCKISDYDWSSASNIIRNNNALINEYNEWKHFYRYDENTLFPKHVEDEDKVILFTCAKNENDYIVEWIEHYLKLGFDKIIICDNNDDDSLESVISEYTNRGVVEIFNCRGFKAFQEGVFKMFCEEGNYKWCAYFDCDEFLELGVYSNIKDYLALKQEDCIAFNWVIFGSGGQLKKSEGNLSERFKVPYLPVLSIYNGFLKGVVRGDRFRFRDIVFRGGHLPCPIDKTKCNNTYNIGGYYVVNKAPFQTQYPLRYKEGYIKHYYTKSFDEWINKARRGWPLNTKSLPFYKYFVLENDVNISKDKYERDLFLNYDWYKTISKDILSFLKDRNIAELVKKDSSFYGFVTIVLYLMSQVEGKTFLIKCDELDDFLFTTMLEYAFVTNNNIVYCNSDKEVEIAYNKYRKPCDTYYFWEVF